MPTSTGFLFASVLFFIYQVAPSSSLAIDNNVVGEPQVQCSEDTITFSVRSRNRFTGNIFIKSKFTEPSCRQEYFSNNFNGASFTVRIGQCGMRRIRQLQPNGMNYIIVFVVNFHPQFITKIDRAYNVRCFYAQVDKTVTSQLEVSMISTTELQAQTMLMPNCEYSVRSETLNGPKVRYARVGDRLVHRWECDNPNFGMLVKHCFVNDGQGSSVRVLDARGCPVFTPVVQGNLNYDQSLNLAYVEVWAYKFPDQASLYFQCQIQICNKRENECIGVTPPNCPLIPKNEFAGSAGVIGGPTTGQGPTPIVVNGGNDAYNYGGSAYIPGSAPVVGGPGYANTQIRGSRTKVSRADFLHSDAGRSTQRRTVSILEDSVTPRNFSAGHTTHFRGTTDPGKKQRRAAAAAANESAESDSTRPIVSTTDETLDVASESLLIIDLEDETDDDGVATFAMKHDEDGMPQDSVCIPPTRLGILMSCFVLMAMVITVLLCYIAKSKDLFFKRSAKAKLKDFSSDSENTDSKSVCSAAGSSDGIFKQTSSAINVKK